MLLWRVKASMRRDEVVVHIVVPDQEAMTLTHSIMLLAMHGWTEKCGTKLVSAKWIRKVSFTDDPGREIRHDGCLL